LKRGRINNASNTITVTSDSACNSDKNDAISVKGIENCAFLDAGTNKVAKKLGTFENSSYLCSRKESPSYAKYLGQLLKSDLENNPARMRYAEAQASERGLYF
jgi:hypothetical protein